MPNPTVPAAGPGLPSATRRAALLGVATLPTLAAPALALPGLAPAAIAGPPSPDLLEAYSTWLFYERRRLQIELYGVDGARRFGGLVHCDNPAFRWHFPTFGDGSDAPSTRAAAVMALAGLSFAERDLQGVE